MLCYQLKNAGFIRSAHVAQLVEHILGKDEVTGSTPVVGFFVSAEPILGGILKRWRRRSLIVVSRM